MLEKLIEVIVRKETFDDTYLSHRAKIGPAEQFQLQHVLGKCKLSKKKNTIIAPDQEIHLRKNLKKVILYIKLSVRPDPMSQLVPGVTNKLWD